MYAQRRIVTAGTIALCVLAPLAVWAVLANGIIAFGNDYEKSIQWDPGWPIDGTWIVTISTPLGNMIFKAIYVAQDDSKTRFTAILEQINQVPVLIELYPEANHIKFAGGQVVRTGLNSYEATLIEYFTKDADPGSEEIIGAAVVNGNMVLSSPDSAAGNGTGAYYLATQDADSDGFPDVDQRPVRCAPWTWSKKRLTMAPGCVPAPLPGQG